MPENQESEVHRRQSTPNWPLLLGVLALSGLACLLVGAVVVLALPSEPLPTLAARAFVGISGAAKVADGSADEAISPDATEESTPMVPQSGGRSAGDPYMPQIGNDGYDVQRYTIKLILDPAAVYVEGATTIEAVSELQGLAQLSLDFIGYEISGVTVDGIASSFSRENGKLIVNLPAPLPVGTTFTIVVAYLGAPVQEPSPYTGLVDHLGLQYPDGESIYVYAEPDGARYWFPANDHPRDKATFRFELVVPPGLTAVANGQLLETRPSALPDGQLGELFIWEHNFPMAPYLALAAVGRYERLNGTTPGGIPLRHYVFPELREELAAATDVTPEAIEWLSDLFGPYPFESFGYATAHIPGGAMENQTMVLMSEGVIGPRTAVHELAHMWFGDWVSLDSWGEMWRKEGFATYLTFMWLARDDPEELESQIAGVRSAVEGNGKIYDLNNPPAEYLFEFNVYFKGALAVHALRQEVGDEAFFAGLRTYLERYGGGTASDAQFIEAMEEAAGIPLDNYVATWFGP